MGEPVSVLMLLGDAVQAAGMELALDARIEDVRVTTERTAAAGLDRAAQEPFDVVVAGTDLPDAREIDVIRRLTQANPDRPVLALLGRGTERLAAAALRAGADDVVTNGPSAAATLPLAVLTLHERALQARRVVLLQGLAERLEGESAVSGILEASAAGIAQLMGADSAAVWLLAETGATEARLGEPPLPDGGAVTLLFDGLPEGGEAWTALPEPDEYGMGLAGVWATGVGGEQVLMALGRLAGPWAPADSRWLELGAHAVLDAISRAMERDRSKKETGGDPVTGLSDARRFRAQLEAESERARRSAAAVAVLLLEVDGIDDIRGDAGEDIAEAALGETAAAIARCLRRYDVAARLEGARFGILLPGADRARAELVGARVRDAVGAVEFPVQGRLTVSAGVAACPEAVEAVDELLDAAEQALLVGRRTGDTVVSAPARRRSEPPAGRW